MKKLFLLIGLVVFLMLSLVLYNDKNLLGTHCIEKIEQVDLDEKERKEFMHSIDAVKALWEAASKIDPDLSK